VKIAFRVRPRLQRPPSLLEFRHSCFNPAMRGEVRFFDRPWLAVREGVDPAAKQWPTCRSSLAISLGCIGDCRPELVGRSETAILTFQPETGSFQQRSQFATSPDNSFELVAAHRSIGARLRAAKSISPNHCDRYAQFPRRLLPRARTALPQRRSPTTATAIVRPTLQSTTRRRVFLSRLRLRFSSRYAEKPCERIAYLPEPDRGSRPVLGRCPASYSVGLGRAKTSVPSDRPRRGIPAVVNPFRRPRDRV